MIRPAGDFRDDAWMGAMVPLGPSAVWADRRMRGLGHHRLGGRLFHNHINFHHTYYARGHLASAVYRGTEGNNTPFFLIPTTPGRWRSVFHPAIQSICCDGACQCAVI